MRAGNKWKYASGIAWAALLVLAVYYARERLFADASYYFFHSIDQGYPQIDHHRFVLAISEALPLLGSYLGLPLKSLVLLYSLGHVIFSLFLFYCIRKEEGSAAHQLMVLMLQFTGYSILFFSPMLEFWYGLVLLVYIDHRIAIGRIQGPWDVLLLTCLAITVLFSHPENFIGLIFIVVLRGADNTLNKKWLLAAVLLMASIAVFKFATFSDYEAGKVGYAQNTFNSGTISTFNWEYIRQLGHMLCTEYYDCLAYLFIGVVGLFIFKHKTKALLISSAVISFLLFINLALHRNTFSRYTESYYLPFTFFCVYAMCNVWPLVRGRSKTILGIVVVGLSIARLYSVTSFGELLKQRSETMDEVIALARNDHNGKMVLKMEYFQAHQELVSWSYPIEVLLVSAMDGREQAVSVILEEDLDFDDNRKTSRPDNFILRRWEVMDYKDLDRSYFKLQEVPYSLHQ